MLHKTQMTTNKTGEKTRTFRLIESNRPNEAHRIIDMSDVFFLSSSFSLSRSSSLFIFAANLIVTNFFLYGTSFGVPFQKRSILRARNHFSSSHQQRIFYFAAAVAVAVVVAALFVVWRARMRHTLSYPRPYGV